MLLDMIKIQTNTFFVTAQKKVLWDVEMFAMIMKHYYQEKSINQ